MLYRSVVLGKLNITDAGNAQLSLGIFLRQDFPQDSQEISPDYFLKWRVQEKDVVVEGVVWCVDVVVAILV